MSTIEDATLWKLHWKQTDVTGSFSPALFSPTARVVTAPKQQAVYVLTNNEYGGAKHVYKFTRSNDGLVQEKIATLRYNNDEHLLPIKGSLYLLSIKNDCLVVRAYNEAEAKQYPLKDQHGGSLTGATLSCCCSWTTGAGEEKLFMLLQQGADTKICYYCSLDAQLEGLGRLKLPNYIEVGSAIQVSPQKVLLCNRVGGSIMHCVTITRINDKTIAPRFIMPKERGYLFINRVPTPFVLSAKALPQEKRQFVAAGTSIYYIEPDNVIGLAKAAKGKDLSDAIGYQQIEGRLILPFEDAVYCLGKEISQDEDGDDNAKVVCYLGELRKEMRK